MSEVSRIVSVDGAQRWTCPDTGKALTLPADWEVLAPGDATLTRRVKAGGAHWVLQEKRGRRVFSRGVCAPRERIERLRPQLERERATPEYRRRLQASRERRQRAHADYVEDFRGAVLDFLAFDARYAHLAEALAEEVTELTTPVGSGTVGRTKRIPIEERAGSAVIAWLRHNTTGYDDMDIPRVRGKRREVRRRLARRSRALLDRLRKGEELDPEACPLHKALKPSSKPRPQPAAQPLAAPAQAPARPAGKPKGLGVSPRQAKTRLWNAPLRKRG